MGGASAGRTVRHPVLVGSLAFLLLVLLFLARAVALEQCVKVRITNCYARSVTMAHGPVTLCAEARVTPDAAHRYLELEMVYADPDRSMDISADDTPEMLREPDKQDGPVPRSVIQLDGAAERIRHDRKFVDLYGGQYEVRATVYADEALKKVCGRATARVVVH